MTVVLEGGRAARIVNWGGDASSTDCIGLNGVVIGSQIHDQGIEETHILPEPRCFVAGALNAAPVGSYFLLRTLQPAGGPPLTLARQATRWLRYGSCILEEWSFGVRDEPFGEDYVPHYPEVVTDARTGAIEGPSELEGCIRAAMVDCEIDGDATRQAAEALDDGVLLATQLTRYAAPAVDFSEDGALSLEWKRDGRGVLIVAAGGGTPAYSVKAPGTFYTTLTEFGIGVALPPELAAALEDMSSGHAS